MKILHSFMSAALAAAMAGLCLTAPAFAQDEEINVMMFSLPVTRGIADLADEFEKETGIKVNVEVVGQSVFENQVMLAFTGRTGDLDVVHVPAIQLQRWVAAGWLTPMDDQIAQMEDVDGFFPSALSTYEVNGKTYALPMFVETGLMAYRKDLIDTPPKTWEETRKVAAEVNSDETAGIVMRTSPGQGFNMFVLPMITRAYGGKFFKDFPTDMTPVIDSPENLEGLDLYTSMLTESGPPGISNINYPEAVAAMQAGNVAIFIDGTSNIVPTLDPKASKVADKIGLAPVPEGPDGRSPAIAVHGLGIPAASKNAEAAAKFIDWATSEKVQEEIAIRESFPDFTRPAVGDDPEVAEKYAEISPDLIKLRADSLNATIPNYRPLIVEWPEIGAAIGDNVNSALNGIQSNADALKNAQTEVEAILNQ
ncbi:ABC transporter substrate-binding protein [Martelella sp. AMO21009]